MIFTEVLNNYRRGLIQGDSPVVGKNGKLPITAVSIYDFIIKRKSHTPMWLTGKA